MFSLDFANGCYTIKRDYNSKYDYSVYKKNSPLSVGGFYEMGIYSKPEDKVIIKFAKKHLIDIIPSFKRKCDEFLSSDFFVDNSYYREI